MSYLSGTMRGACQNRGFISDAVALSGHWSALLQIYCILKSAFSPIIVILRRNMCAETLFLHSISISISLLLSHISEWSGRSAHAGQLSRTLAFYYSWPKLPVWILLRGASSISSFITATLSTIRLPSAAVCVCVCARSHSYMYSMCVCVCLRGWMN